MSFQHYPGMGTVHLQEVKPARVVPGPERHKWASKPAWGQSTTCLKCGCVKHRLKTQPDWCERYQPAGTTELLPERPACTGTLPAAAKQSHQKPACPAPAHPPAPGLFD